MHPIVQYSQTHRREKRGEARGGEWVEKSKLLKKRKERNPKHFGKRRNKQSSLKLRVSELLKLLPIFCPYSVLWT